MASVSVIGSASKNRHTRPESSRTPCPWRKQTWGWRSPFPSSSRFLGGERASEFLIDASSSGKTSWPQSLDHAFGAPLHTFLLLCDERRSHSDGCHLDKSLSHIVGVGLKTWSRCFLFFLLLVFLRDACHDVPPFSSFPFFFGWFRLTRYAYLG